MMLSRFYRLASLLLLPFLVSAGPATTSLSNTVLDSSGIFFVSYDGLVNVNSFQLSGLITYQNYQYAGWYTSSKSVVLARRTTTSSSSPFSPSWGAWSTLTLNHTLVATDSHNVVTLGVSPGDGRIHVALDCHSTPMYYTVSATGVAGTGVTWSASLFGSIGNNIGNLAVGSQITYPQFVVTPSNALQFVYRTGVSGNGDYQLAEYSSSSETWSSVGLWASKSGTYTGPSGATSAARSLYIHGFTYRGSRLHVTGTWRENSASVSCSSGGLTNHDTVYFYSDDSGRTWKNPAGTTIATSGSSPITVSSSGIIVDSLNADHGLMNQESQDVDSAGRIHAIISYVPGRFGQCVTNYATDRTAYARPFHVYQAANGSFVKMEIPFAINGVGRSQIAIDSADNVYVVMPYVRVVSASASSAYTDWTEVYNVNGTAAGLNAFGEVTLDRPGLVASGRESVGVLYQVSSSGTTPSPVRVVEFDI